MYQEKKRERRIRDLRRMKAKAKRIYDEKLGRHVHFVNECGRYREGLKRHLKTAEYLAVCSCTMCGNPRRHYGYRTFSEERLFQKDRY